MEREEGKLSNGIGENEERKKKDWMEREGKWRDEIEAQRKLKYWDCFR